jgi:hypothetical protein
VATDREGVFELTQVVHEVRAAIRSLVHSGTPEQLAQGQHLLEQTRRTLYLILAGDAEAASDGPADDSAFSEPGLPEIG